MTIRIDPAKCHEKSPIYCYEGMQKTGLTVEGPDKHPVSLGCSTVLAYYHPCLHTASKTTSNCSMDQTVEVVVLRKFRAYPNTDTPKVGVPLTGSLAKQGVAAVTGQA